MTDINMHNISSYKQNNGITAHTVIIGEKIAADKHKASTLTKWSILLGIIVSIVTILKYLGIQIKGVI